jgi:hypothetical protein
MLCLLLSCRTHPLIPKKLHMGFHIIMLLGEVPLGVITYDDLEYWPVGVDQ